MSNTSKTAKIIKGDITQHNSDTLKCALMLFVNTDRSKPVVFLATTNLVFQIKCFFRLYIVGPITVYMQFSLGKLHEIFETGMQTSKHNLITGLDHFNGKQKRYLY